MKNPVVVLFVGRSGSGKGTQAGYLRRYLEQASGPDSVKYIYTGEQLRTLAKRADVLTGRFVAEKVMNAGNKAPDFLAVWSWGSWFVEHMDQTSHIIVDGSPRTVAEARLLDEAFEFYGRTFVFPIFLDVSPEEAFSRMKDRGRADDTDTQIKNRLKYYEKYVAPALRYYEKESKNRLIVINGEPHDQEAIHQNIVQTLRL